MSLLKRFETLVESVQLTGLLYGRAARALQIKGRRAGFTSVTALNDLKEYDNAVADIPELSNATLDIISSSANDTNTSGTGVRQVKVVYIDSSNNLVESAAINLNGTTLVTSVLTGVTSVLWMESSTVGSGGRAAGNIRLRINGGTTETEQISAGFNKSMTAFFQVPAGHVAYMVGWRTSALVQEQEFRVQATVTSLGRTLSSSYISQANASCALNTNNGFLPVDFLKFPALSKIKGSTVSGGLLTTVRADVSFSVVLVAD